ncbi:MAG: YlxR family protein [Deltaproteobacteria bacterium]|nr:MAG: YlxR family protein [Deltaproteobacteria bacterium]TMQ12326.1 MAG: YlxR family protein [Deltaproteobacteria bacterium]
MRTCTGCRQVAPQRALVRLVLDGARLVVDGDRCRPGRGAYVHPRPACVTAAGLSRSFRRAIHPADVAQIVSEMSPNDDNSPERVSKRSKRSAKPPAKPSGDQPLQNTGQNVAGLADGDTVEMPPRIKAKDDRSEDARV